MSRSPGLRVGYRAAAATAWLALALLASCATSTFGYEPPRAADVQLGMSKEDVYRRFGVPSQILRRGDVTSLIYSSDLQRGMSMRVGGGAVPLRLLEFGHSHRGTDALMILIGANDEVIRVDQADYAKLAEWSLWPFGS